MPNWINFINPEDRLECKHVYALSVGWNTTLFIAFANYKQDAIDIFLDYFELEYPEFLMSKEKQAIETDLWNFLSGGIHNRYLSTFNVSLYQVR